MCVRLFTVTNRMEKLAPVESFFRSILRRINRIVLLLVTDLKLMARSRSVWLRLYKQGKNWTGQ